MPFEACLCLPVCLPYVLRRPLAAAHALLYIYNIYIYIYIGVCVCVCVCLFVWLPGCVRFCCIFVIVFVYVAVFLMPFVSVYISGLPGLRRDFFDQVDSKVLHCALSLVGEPIMYPRINELLHLMHQQHISSFLVSPPLLLLLPLSLLLLLAAAATRMRNRASLHTRDAAHAAAKPARMHHHRL